MGQSFRTVGNYDVPYGTHVYLILQSYNTQSSIAKGTGEREKEGQPRPGEAAVS